MKKIILSVFGMLVMAAGLQAQELIKDNEFDNADLTTEYGSKDNVTFGTWCAVNDETAASFRIINDKQRQSIGIFRRPQTDYLVQVVRGTTLRRQRRTGYV